VETLLDEAEGEGDLAPWVVPLAAMREQTGRMEQLLADLLLLSRLDESPRAVLMRPVDLTLLLRRCCAEARRLAGEKVTIQAEIVDPLVLRGVEGELRSVFDNLLSNAVKYTPPGGTVHLEAGFVGEELQIAVTDTGIGIAPEHLPRLTERFYRVDGGRGRDQGGTGLGLAIVKHALQRHDAQLNIESRLGMGSRFLCRFPRDRVLAGSALSNCG
jgi:two-component system phosphate regulon sensor histidine kinase PhoR